MDKGTHLCYRCGVRFSSKQSLYYHLNKAIRCDKLTCNMCNNVFKSLIDYNINITECSNVKYKSNFENFSKNPILTVNKTFARVSTLQTSKQKWYVLNALRNDCLKLLENKRLVENIFEECIISNEKSLEFLKYTLVYLLACDGPKV